MLCPKCGNSLPDNAAFCVECGTRINPVAAPAPPVNTYTPPVNTYTPPVNTYTPPSPPPQPAYTPPSPPPQPTYMPPPAQAAADTTVGVGEWFLVFLLSAIPVVGIIMTFVWAFGSSVKPSKKNYAKMVLIVMLISIGLSVLLGIILLIAGVSLGGLLQDIVYNLPAWTA